MSNPLSGHTSTTGFGASAQGLRDGDGLTSPSLTNPYEGIHGNGIVRLEDGAIGASSRNSTISPTPGFVDAGASDGELVVSGGYCTLDGVLYQFAGGPGNTYTFTVGTSSNYSGTIPATPTTLSDFYVVVYLDSDDTSQHVKYEIGTPTVISTGTPLLPYTFLSDPAAGANLNRQTTVLAIVRYTWTANTALPTGLNSAAPVIHDRRTFIRNSPIYLQPLTKGANDDVSDGNEVNGITYSLDDLYGAPEVGNLAASNFGALWQSHSREGHAVLYYTARRDMQTTPVRHTWRINPEIRSDSPSGNFNIKFDEANIFHLTPSASITIGTTGAFPHGHAIEIRNGNSAGTDTITFQGVVIGLNEYARFVYDGSAWKTMFHVVSL
tara:strand:- start:14984 stop:16126 length:1143 start_codon:yes stop_codon:yes gene_type:complete